MMRIKLNETAFSKVNYFHQKLQLFQLFVSADGMTSLETTLSSIVFEELLYKGTFKIVHKASIGTAEVVVKRLRGMSQYLTKKSLSYICKKNL